LLFSKAFFAEIESGVRFRSDNARPPHHWALSKSRIGVGSRQKLKPQGICSRTVLVIA
jgi:hypothetical protein